MWVTPSHRCRDWPISLDRPADTHSDYAAGRPASDVTQFAGDAARGRAFRTGITERLPGSNLEGDTVTEPVCEPVLVDLPGCHRKHRFNGAIDVGLLVVP